MTLGFIPMKTVPQLVQALILADIEPGVANLVGYGRLIAINHARLREFHLKQVEQKLCNLFYRR